MPLKVYDLAKEYKLTNTEMLEVLRKQGFARLSPSSDLDDESVQRVRTSLADAAAQSDKAGGSTEAASRSAAATTGRPASAGESLAAAAGAPAAGDSVEVPKKLIKSAA